MNSISLVAIYTETLRVFFDAAAFFVKKIYDFEFCQNVSISKYISASV